MIAVRTSLLLALFASGRAAAEETLVAPPIEVIDSALSETPSDAPPSALASRLSLVDAQSEGRTLAEVLEGAAALHVRSLGGLGAFSTLSIRGSSASQVAVLVDGIPITPASHAIVSLGDLPVDGFDAVDVYRGVAPVSLGGLAIGGVVNLRSATKLPGPSAIATVGSFGTLRLALAAPVRHLRHRLVTRLSLFATRGDFDFYDDNGTRQNPSDDRIRPRRNNELELVEAGVVDRYRFSRSARLDSSAALSMRRGGVAGLGTYQAVEAQSRLLRALATTALRHGWRGGQSAGARLSLRAETSAFVDRDNEIGIGAQDRRDLTLYGQLAFPVGLLALGGLVELQGAGSFERYSAHDPIAAIAEPPAILRSMATVSGAFERSWSDLSARAAASVSIIDDGYATHDAAIGSAIAAGNPMIRLEPAAAFGLRLAVLPWLTLRSNATTAERTPSFEELFGNSGAVQGNPELGPERAIGADVALTGNGHGLEMTFGGFIQEVRDLIQFAQTSQRTVRAGNVGKALLAGLQLGARWSRWRWFSAAVSYDYLLAENRTDRPAERGKRVVGHPEHDVHAAANVRAGPFGLGVDLDFVSGTFLDPANFQELPSRLLLGGTARLSPSTAPWLSFALSVRNALDHIVAQVKLRPPPRGGRPVAPEPVSDYGGFPLPGRTLLLTVRIAQPATNQMEDHR